MLDVIMMRLRTADGLDLREFERSYGSSSARAVASALEPHWRAGLVQLCDSSPSSSRNSSDSRDASAPQQQSASAGALGDSMNGNSEQRRTEGVWEGASKESLGCARVRLTDPEGFLISNDVISDVFAALPS